MTEINHHVTGKCQFLQYHSCQVLSDAPTKKQWHDPINLKETVIF